MAPSQAGAPGGSAAPAGSNSNSAVNVAAAVAAAKKEKRAAAAAASMAPRMQSQVQKWAKMTAELVGEGKDGDKDNGDGIRTLDSQHDAGRRSTKKAKRAAKDPTALISSSSRLAAQQAKLRAPHRRDRYISFGIGAGVGTTQSAAAAAMVNSSSSSRLPPTCLLCLVRFETRQQLRDHEALSTRHRRRLRDGAARRAALQRYARVVEGAAAAAAGAANDNSSNDKDNSDNEPPSTTQPASATRPPTNIKRLPRRRGDLAPVYTSYAAPISIPARLDTTTDDPNNNDDDGTATITTVYHCCLLCRRRFRSRATLRVHERESALHRTRTRDPAAVAAAVAAVNAAAEEAAEAEKKAAAAVARDGEEEEEKEEKDEEEQTAASARRRRLPPHRPLLRMRPAAATTTTAATAQYRDRARERRLAFGQPGAPGSSNRKRAAAAPTSAASAGRQTSDASAAAAAMSAAPPPPAPPPSKGAALLSKMGWTAGQGLGAAGAGRTEAIAPAVYRSGVGLGAQGGKLGDAADVAARRTESRYADFVEQTQELARQRFLALDRAEAQSAASPSSAEGPGADVDAERRIDDNDSRRAPTKEESS